jgi:hypothetical protein
MGEMRRIIAREEQDRQEAGPVCLDASDPSVDHCHCRRIPKRTDPKLSFTLKTRAIG